MGSKAIDAVAEIIIGIIGLAIVALLVAQSSQTGSLIGQFFGGLSTTIGAAVKPASGG